ncbi:MAG TPA: alpha/beta fold hydrolase, partial [Planctomycetota bacterium]|nr:alpha/beta fold hydrolase [Planctomycetota bacterium]
VWNTLSGERTDLSLETPDVIWLRTIGWAPQADAASPARLAVARLSDDFRTLDTYLWSESTGLVKVMTDHDERWIGGPVDRARWSLDGARLIFGSESYAASSTPGHAQLFELDASTQVVRQLTQVSGEVSSFSQSRDGGIVFSYSETAASDQRRLGYIPKSGSVQELDAPVGFNANPQFADDSSLVIFTHSRMFQPAELWSLDQPSKQPAQRLSRTTPPDFAKRDWIHPALFEVAGARGAVVMSHVFLPRSSSLEHPDRPRATIVFIHGAGYLQNVTDSMTEYEPNLLFHSRLAGLGYVVVDVDYRGSEGYGQDFRTAEQYHLGGLELDDIHATLDQLIARGVIDGKRVGCYGGSYGGFLTLMALFTAGERWSAGAALRSVTDWRTYHPGYTQPRLGRPSTHADAYARSSPIDHAEGLTKPLLLLHGMMDDNVFAQDTIRLMEKLIDLGKDFEVMLYPSQKHAFTDGAHWLDEYKRIERFLIEHIGPP